MSNVLILPTMKSCKVAHHPAKSRKKSASKVKIQKDKPSPALRNTLNVLLKCLESHRAPTAIRVCGDRHTHGWRPPHMWMATATRQQNGIFA